MALNKLGYEFISSSLSTAIIFPFRLDIVEFKEKSTINPSTRARKNSIKPMQQQPKKRLRAIPGINQRWWCRCDSKRAKQKEISGVGNAFEFRKRVSSR